MRRAGEHLPPTGLRELAWLGFEDLLGDTQHEASPGVRSVWGQHGFVDKEYFGSPPGRGLNLRREVFDEALAQRAERRGVGLHFGTRLLQLVAESGGHVATVNGPQGSPTLRAELVVDASGRAATAARLLGASRRRCDQLLALVGHVDQCAATDEPGQVQLESLEDGWWYGVQFANGTLLAAFMTDAATVRRHPGRARGLWQRRLQDSRLLQPLARTGCWSGRLQTFDAATQWLDIDARPGFLAVGDAAAAYDPLSSWGITKGLVDGHTGAVALARESADDGTAVARHRDRRQRDFEAFRSRQLQFYRAETRWPASPFWQSRHAPAQAV